MSRFRLHRAFAPVKNVLTTMVLALSINAAVPPPPVEAGILRGALGGAVVGGIIGGRRGARAGAVVGGIAGAIRAGDRRRAASAYERRGRAYDRDRLEEKRRLLRRRR